MSEDQPYGVPKTPLKQVMQHYDVDRETAEKMLKEKSIDKLLPERGTGFTLNIGNPISKFWRFIRDVFSANHDYPYHDFIKIKNEDEENNLKGVYIVGQENRKANGDQSKFFVSKRTNIWTDCVLTTVKFNDARNVEISLPLKSGDSTLQVANYEKEFHTNISSVYYNIVAEGTLYIYCEGVLPQEARDAE